MPEDGISPPETAGRTSVSTRLNDAIARWAGIPFFGISIPNVMRLVDHDAFSLPEILFSYTAFIAVAAVIWHGNVFAYYYVRPRLDAVDRPGSRVLALMLMNLIATLPVSVVLLALWSAALGIWPANWQAVIATSALIFLSVIIVTQLYETVFLIKESAAERLKTEQLDRARLEAELDALKSQIDPHFMFNALNSLAYLIGIDDEKAHRFNSALARVYRYMLSTRRRDLSTLGDEIEILRTYLELACIRFGDCISLEMNLDGSALDTHYLPSISLQVLLENAIKHNEMDAGNPLCFRVSLNGSVLIVGNELRPRKYAAPSTGSGLENLDRRCRLIAGRPLEIVKTNGRFEVHVPVITSEEHAHSDRRR